MRVCSCVFLQRKTETEFWVYMRAMPLNDAFGSVVRAQSEGCVTVRGAGAGLEFVHIAAR